MKIYHCTWTKLVPRIQKQGLRAFQTSNWKNDAGARQGGGAVFVFVSRWDAIRWAAKMDWDFNRAHGTGKVSILAIEDAGPWEVDGADPLSQAICEAEWLKAYRLIPAAAIVATEVLTADMVKALVKYQQRVA
jgi:hypothetical protein